jgi:putative FmdB family regulatory protein
MPLFDFRCGSCGKEFEALVRPSEKTQCPSCKSSNLEQLQSMFAIHSLDTTKARVRTARKEIRQSRAFRDKSVADREEIERHHH